MNHKWENNKCIKCGIIRTEIKSADGNETEYNMYQYSDNGKSWVIKRPDCPEIDKVKNHLLPDPKGVERVNRMMTDQEIKQRDNSKSFSIQNIIQDKEDKSTKNYKQNYADLLRSPKWQRKRLEIMQRDNWRCKSCDDDLNELHVHHLIYTTDKPWDELNENLVTLCNTCHKALHYLSACPDIGMETFVLLVKFLDEKEQKDIENYFKRKNDGIA